jgi:hypothetical protein
MNELEEKRRILIYSNDQVGLFGMGICAGIILGLSALGDSYFGDLGAGAGAIIGIVVAILWYRFCTQQEKRILRGEWDDKE